MNWVAACLFHRCRSSRQNSKFLFGISLYGGLLCTRAVHPPKGGLARAEGPSLQDPSGFTLCQLNRNSAAAAQIWTSPMVYNKQCFLASKIPVLRCSWPPFLHPHESDGCVYRLLLLCTAPSCLEMPQGFALLMAKTALVMSQLKRCNFSFAVSGIFPFLG